MSQRRFLPCTYCNRRTAIDGKDVWHEPAGPMAESDEYSEERVTCAECARSLCDGIDATMDAMEAQYIAEHDRDEELNRFGQQLIREGF